MSGPAPSQVGLASASVGPFSSTSYGDGTAGGAVLIDFTPGTTLVILFELVALVQQTLWLYAHGPTGGSRGWLFSLNNTGAFSLVLQGGSGSQQMATGLKVGAIICAAITHTAGGAVRYSLNGLPVVQSTASATYVAVNASTQHLIGRNPSGEGFSSVAAASGAKIMALAWRKAASSDADLVAFSNAPNTVNPARLPAALTTAVLADGGMIAYPLTDWNGSDASFTASIGSDRPTWTWVGTLPAKNAIDAYARYEVANVPEVWHDNQRFDTLDSLGNPLGYVQHDFLGRIRFRSTAREVMTGTVYNNIGVVNSNNVGLVVAGVDQQPHGLHAIGFNQVAGSGIRYAGLAAGLKEFQLLEGYKNRIPTDAPNDWTGVYQQWFQVPASADFEWILPTAPARRLFILGDSMSDKINPTTNITSPTYQTWPRLLRNGAPTNTAVASMSASGAGLYHYAGAVGDTAKFNALLALILANLDGTSENYFLLELGINDWSQSLQSLANYVTTYEDLIDAVRAAGKPGFRFIALGPTWVSDETTPNAFGYVLQDVRDANAASCAARSAWATYINGRGLVTDVTDYGPDGVHFNVAPDGVGGRGGHKNYFDALLVAAPQLYEDNPEMFTYTVPERSGSSEVLRTGFFITEDDGVLSGTMNVTDDGGSVIYTAALTAPQLATFAAAIAAVKATVFTELDVQEV